MDKEKLLTESKVFCMAPWVHAHTNPIGDAHPCCIGKGIFAKQADLNGIVNSEGMKSLRHDMLNEVQNNACMACHLHEAQGVPSFRSWFNKEYGSHLDYSLVNTRKDGTLDHFKMRYFDLRFNNICNFKCRTCNSSFSSQWEQEDIKRDVAWARVLPKNDQILDEVLPHVPFMEHAYFAGGEPLITEEHYVLLEEMIRLGKTNIKLKYNSNVSNLKFKSKDIVDLWSRFEHPIEMAASIDHYGVKAEYIRNGTNWSQVESNLIKLKNTNNVKLSLNSVINIFNYVSFAEFLTYLDSIGIISPGVLLTPYNMVDPLHLAAQALPRELKEQGKASMIQCLTSMSTLGYHPHQIALLKKSIEWVDSVDTWDKYKITFQEEVKVLDNLRNENFLETFPELGSLLDA
jgi:sulfatase maturation enzyme AslB (radical SAM superfamily)